MKKTLAVLFGGCSSEYEVSLHSAAAVIDAVDRARYELLTVGITRSGQWLLYPGGTEAILQDSWWRHADCVPALLSPSREDHGLWLAHADGWVCKPLDLVFPVLHGKNGEDGTVQGLLELAGIPFVGCGCLCSALCMDKQVAHALAGQAGIACPPFITVHHAGQPLAQLAQEVTEGMGDIPMPWFVKPAAEGSSFGVSRVQTPAQLPLRWTPPCPTAKSWW
ncbi:MAG: D-alanine--(R)-lactate ligase, partial [Oscillospiraceae bacterium]